jgi:DUF955
MDDALKTKINELANTVLRCYEISTPVTDIAKEVQKLGGTIKDDATLGIYDDGKIEKQDDSFAIIIPANVSNSSKNFTVAHELGHLFIHMGYKINKELWKSCKNGIYNKHDTPELEFQANEFAAAFLMPEETYVKIMRENAAEKAVNIPKIAKYFNVSIDNASYRGKALGYLQ